MSSNNELEEFAYHLNKDKIQEAYERIKNILNKTPVHTSTTINKIVGKNVFFKCENFQKTGAFKARGALNAVLTKFSNADSKFSGCVTHSSGNHGKIYGSYIFSHRLIKLIRNLFY
jgi:threonine dehydratase